MGTALQRVNFPLNFTLLRVPLEANLAPVR
jgi:hypothetical protein